MEAPVNKRRKPEPPLIDDSPGRLIEPLDIDETPAERDLTQAEEDLDADDGAESGEDTGDQVKPGRR